MSEGRIRVSGGPLDGNVYDFPLKQVGDTVDLNTPAGPCTHAVTTAHDGSVILEYLGPAQFDVVEDSIEGSEF
jgi:hypothetical protein